MFSKKDCCSPWRTCSVQTSQSSQDLPTPQMRSDESADETSKGVSDEVEVSQLPSTSSDETVNDLSNGVMEMSNN
jgi:hypothetical protein